MIFLCQFLDAEYFSTTVCLYSTTVPFNMLYIITQIYLHKNVDALLKESHLFTFTCSKHHMYNIREVLNS